MLSSANRLRKQKDFNSVYQRGRKLFGPLFNLRFLVNNLPHSRFAFVVSKQTARKVSQRNLVKRRLRAAVAELITYIGGGFDIVISVKKEALDKSYQELRDEMVVMLKKAGLINPKINTQFLNVK